MPFPKKHPLTAAGDILVLAGNTGDPGDDYYNKHPFWNWTADVTIFVVRITHDNSTSRGKTTVIQEGQLLFLASGKKLLLARNIKTRHSANLFQYKTRG